MIGRLCRLNKGMSRLAQKEIPAVMDLRLCLGLRRRNWSCCLLDRLLGLSTHLSFNLFKTHHLGAVQRRS
jgi:hypothetical protein